MKVLHDDIKAMAANRSTTEELWSLFKSKLNHSISTHIPHKTSKPKDSLPWLSQDVRRLIHRRDRLYKRKKKTADPAVAAKHKDAKRLVQKELRRSYWKYIENIVTPSEHENQFQGMKKFWTYIKTERPITTA